jgi:hypothetical protein
LVLFIAVTMVVVLTLSIGEGLGLTYDVDCEWRRNLGPNGGVKRGQSVHEEDL